MMIGGNRGMLNLKKFMLFRYFSIFGFMCVHSQPTKNMFVDTKYKKRKANSLLADFACNNPFSWPFSKWIYSDFFCDHK